MRNAVRSTLDNLRPGVGLLLSGLAVGFAGCSYLGKPAKHATRETILAPPAQMAEADQPAKIAGKDSTGCTWVESESKLTVGDDDSRHQIRARAIAEARKTAMQEFLGVEIRTRSVDFQQEGLHDQHRLTESILQTTRLGRILKEQVVSEDYKDISGCPSCRYHLRLRTCLVPFPIDHDRRFHVELEISRTRFVEGDEATLKITAERDCYLYVYNVGMDWQTTLLVPNQLLPEVRLRAGENWAYPEDFARGRGLRLVAQLPVGKEVSAETIRVIVSKTPIPDDLRDPSKGFLAILQRMNSSRIDWVDDAQAFTVYRR